MSIYRGLRGMGKMTPEVRGALKGLRDSLRTASQHSSRVTSNESNVPQQAEQKNIRQGTFMYGTAADRPSSNYLQERSIKSILYFATDTFVLSAWTGTAWKTTTLT